jgi:hypothetical protein
MALRQHRNADRRSNYCALPKSTQARLALNLLSMANSVGGTSMSLFLAMEPLHFAFDTNFIFSYVVEEYNFFYLLFSPYSRVLTSL